MLDSSCVMMYCMIKGLVRSILRVERLILKSDQKIFVPSSHSLVCYEIMLVALRIMSWSIYW